MAIALDTTNLFEITTFGGLTDAVTKWLDRDDLTERVPYFIALAEARFRRVLRCPEREKVVALGTGGTIELPVDFDSARYVYITDQPSSVVTAVTPADLYNRYANFKDQRPLVYSIIAGQMVFGPIPDADYGAMLIYQTKIPPLSAAVQSNWLIADHPDLYLYATLLEAEAYGWNDERLPLIKGKVDEALDEINMAGTRKRYGGGPLIPRPAVEEGLSYYGAQRSRYY